MLFHAQHARPFDGNLHEIFSPHDIACEGLRNFPHDMLTQTGLVNLLEEVAQYQRFYVCRARDLGNVLVVAANETIAIRRLGAAVIVVMCMRTSQPRASSMSAGATPPLSPE